MQYQHYSYQYKNNFRSRIMNALWISVFIFLGTNNAFAQDVKVSARIDSSSIMIGDQINLELTATYDPQLFKVQFPQIQDTFNHFEVVERAKMDTVIGRGDNIYKQRVLITNFDSGQWKIPSLGFDILPLKGAEPKIIYTDSFLINVNTVEVDTAKPIKPIFGIRGATMPIKQIILYVIAGILIAALLGFLLWYLYKTIRDKNNKPLSKETELILPPHEKALQALSRIEQQALWQNNQEKQYHTLLTDTVRLYLEEQFTIDCFEKTSSEIIQQVKKIKALSTSRQSLRTIFDTADMVKFAKSKPTPEEHIESMQLAKEIIIESYKKVKPVVGNSPSTNGA